MEGRGARSWIRVAALGVALLVGPGSAGAEQAWLELMAPSPGQVATGAIPLFEVRGRAGRGSRDLYDVMVAVDLSPSTLLPAGFDVDGDGEVGAPRGRGPGGLIKNPRRWITDPGDTIVQAELAMARRIIQQLSLDDARIGLLTFRERPRRRAGIGDPEDALRALASVRVPTTRRGTDLAAATRSGVRALHRARTPGRQPVLLILSDGHPTAPFPEVHARHLALREAARAAKLGIQIYGLALGGPDRDEVLSEMAARTGGEFIHVSHPSRALERLPQIELASLEEVTIYNRTVGAPARAVRFFSDGSFDGFAPLAPGENVLEITARTRDGAEARVRRTVRFEQTETVPANLLDDLADRTRETELAIRARSGHDRALTLEVD